MLVMVLVWDHPSHLWHFLWFLTYASSVCRTLPGLLIARSGLLAELGRGGGAFACNIVSIYYMDIIKGLFIIHSLLLFIIQFNLVNEEQKINIYLYTLTISSQMYYFTHLIIIYIYIHLIIKCVLANEKKMSRVCVYIYIHT